MTRQGILNIFAQADGFSQLKGKKRSFRFIEGCPSLMKINVGFYIKNYFGNYQETRATRKKIKKLQKQKNCYCLFCVPFWCSATCDFLLPAKQNVLIGHFVDIAQSSVIVIQNHPARTVKLFQHALASMQCECYTPRSNWLLTYTVKYNNTPYLLKLTDFSQVSLFFPVFLLLILNK